MSQEQLDAALARASQAERSLATVTAERDEARAANRDNLAMWEVERDALKAKLAEAERENLTLRNRIGIDRTSWHEAEAEVKVLRAKLAKTERERDDAMTLAEERRDYARAQNAKLSAACDALKAKLAEAERMRDTLGRRIDEVQAALNECGAGFTGQKESTRIRALCAKLAKTERVVEAAREDAQHCPHACSPPCPFDRAVARTRAALRALDSPVVAGTDSGGSGAAPNPGEAASAIGNGPEPAGSSQNSPVGVAATAEDGHEAPARNRQPVEPPSDPATGTTRREPPETDRQDGSRGVVADDQPASALLEKRADGWHYHDAEYPDEGYVGPFSLAIAAIAHAEGAGYLVDGADEHAPATRSELEELRREVERLENLTGSGSGSGSGSG